MGCQIKNWAEDYLGADPDGKDGYPVFPVRLEFNNSVEWDSWVECERWADVEDEVQLIDPDRNFKWRAIDSHGEEWKVAV